MRTPTECVCVCVCVCVCKLTRWSYAGIEVAVTGQLGLAQGRLRPVETEGARNRLMYFWTLGLQKSGERTVWSANGTWISI